MFGLATTGGSWWIVSYDGETFEVNEVFNEVFETVSADKARWVKDCSLMVHCV